MFICTWILLHQNAECICDKHYVLQRTYRQWRQNRFVFHREITILILIIARIWNYFYNINIYSKTVLLNKIKTFVTALFLQTEPHLFPIRKVNFRRYICRLLREQVHFAVHTKVSISCCFFFLFLFLFCFFLHLRNEKHFPRFYRATEPRIEFGDPGAENSQEHSVLADINFVFAFFLSFRPTSTLGSIGRHVTSCKLKKSSSSF